MREDYDRFFQQFENPVKLWLEGSSEKRSDFPFTDKEVLSCLRYYSIHEIASFSWLNNKVQDLKPYEIYEPYPLMIRFIVATMLLKSDKEKALELLTRLDLKEIANPVLLRTAKKLEHELLAEEKSQYVCLFDMASKL